MLKYKLLLLYFFIPSIVWCQLISPEGIFLQDSMKVGEEISYILTIKYPEDQNILFPDSSFNYSPFELVSKNYTNTVSKDGFSKDSTIYILRSFDLSSLQTIQLPVYILNGTDSIEVLAQKDTIYLNDIEIKPEEPLRETTDYNEVSLQFNSTYLIIGTIIVLFIIAIVLLIFGDRIKKKIKLYKLRSRHEKFVAEYKKLIEHHNGNSISKDSTEYGLNFWKSYMEKLESVPFTKLTTKEVSQYYLEDNNLQYVLKNMDRNIYGRHNPEEAKINLRSLEEIAKERYAEKVKEVENE